MFVGPVCALRQFFPAVFQHLCLGSHLGLLVLIQEDFRVQVEQVFGFSAGAVVHPVDVVRIRIHLALQGGGYAHLVLQDGASRFTLQHRMAPLTGGALQHEQSVFLRVCQQQGSSPLKVLPAVQVEPESLAGQTVSLDHPVGEVPGVVELYQPALGPVVAFPCQCQVLQVHPAVSQHSVFLLCGDGAGHLVTLLHLNQIHAHRATCLGLR